MHIPENYLSPQTCGVFGLAMVPVWAHCVKKVREEMPREKIAFIGVGAAFSFLLMMLNIPLPGGTTGHAVGGTLVALLVGPEAACIAISVALAIQALLFGDGGVLAFGANCFNMAFIMPFLGYGIFVFVRKHVPASWGDRVAAFVGAYLSMNVAALLAGIEFGIQPLLFTDADGLALYCPYPLAISVPAMLIPHLLVAGVVDGLATVLIYEFVKRSAPGLLYESAGKDPQSKREGTRWAPVAILLGALVVATPLGLLAGSGDGWLAQFGDAWGEWGTEDLAEMVGYTPSGMDGAFSWSALLPDYALEGVPDVVVYVVSAVIGICLLVIIFRVISQVIGDRRAR